MAATTYILNTADWTDCGAADDCAFQTRSNGTIIFTFGAIKPPAGNRDGLALRPGGEGWHTGASAQKPGNKLWARMSGDYFPSGVIVVER